MMKIGHAPPPAARLDAANDNAWSAWADGEDDAGLVISPVLRDRLDAALVNILGVATYGWNDDHAADCLHLVALGYCARDAVAIVSGDAVLDEDGRVDHDPGCSWIDAILARPDRRIHQ